MKRRCYTWSSISLLLSMLLVLVPTGALASGGTVVSFVPSAATAQVGDTVDVDVQITDASNLYAIEVHIVFDPARLQVLDDDPVEPGIQVLSGSLFPKSDPSYVVQNQADNVAGTVDYAITLLAPESPLTGNGTLATIRFAARMEGTAHLGWTLTQLADQDGVPISHSTTDGDIVISQPCTDPGKDCTDLIGNGGFEESTYWDMPVTPHKANYSTADKHGGARSVRLGIESGDADVYSHSSAYQKVRVPANATSVTLTFWARRFTEETPKANVDPTMDLYDPAEVIEGTFDWSAKGPKAQYDWQEVLILQADYYNWLATLMRDRSDDGEWTQYTYDLTTFAGQDIVVYFNVINNGWGNLRTWMYVDDVQVTTCYDDSPCVELVRNRSFEWTADWEHPTTPRPANYTTDFVHSGSRSMRLGIVPPTGDTYSHSSAYQRITIPSGAPQPVLSFWYKAHTEDTLRSEWKTRDWSNYDPAKTIAGEKRDERCCGEVDWQEMLILDESYHLLSGGVVLRQAQNDGAWKQVTYDLSPYKGMTIVLYFNVINDGNGQRTWMYVDDVSVNLCEHQMHFEPSSKQAGVDETFTMDARVESIADLYGFEVVIRFDPAILKVVDADLVTAGVQVNVGAWLPASTHVVVNTVDNASGLINFAATLVSPAPALSGSGNLISIPFRAKAIGDSSVSFTSLKLVNSAAEIIPISREDGQVTVTSNQATLSGQVLLEGRTDHSGTVVQLDGGATVTTASDGSYTFVTSAGSHTLAFSHAAYLSSSVTAVGVAGSTVTVPQVTLLGGDVNGDGHVDILDLVAIGSQFGSTSPDPATADVNADGQVDIVDIVLVAKNFQ